jgi:hypothetical protein
METRSVVLDESIPTREACQHPKSTQRDRMEVQTPMNQFPRDVWLAVGRAKASSSVSTQNAARLGDRALSSVTRRSCHVATSRRWPAESLRCRRQDRTQRTVLELRFPRCDLIGCAAIKGDRTLARSLNWRSSSTSKRDLRLEGRCVSWMNAAGRPRSSRGGNSEIP